MYGLVNRAVEELLISLRGEAGWQRVRERAGCEEDGFVAMQTYPDELTFRLVDAAAAELARPVDEVLQDFGEYWVLYTAARGYGDLMSGRGDSTLQFLRQLNEMHARVETIFHKMTLPWFEVDEATVQDEGFELLYDSPRQGLAPFVVGLVRGLGKRYGESLSIEHIESRATGAPMDRFRIRHLPR